MAEHTEKVFGSSAEHKPLPPMRRILTVKNLPEKGIAYHVNNLRRLWRQGLFPKPFYPTKRRCSWFEEDIDKWLVNKQAEQLRKIDERPRRDEKDEVISR
jgi:hypothetical protein